MKVVVATCNSYTWIVPTFLHFYKKNWPDNPYPTEFVTGTKEIKDIPVFYAGNLSWADRMAKYLESYNEERFILLLDDFIIRKPVNTYTVRRAESFCKGDIGCIRLSASRSKRHHLFFDIGVTGFEGYPLDAPYSVALHPSVWQKEFFLELLQKGENIWQTEIEGSKRIRKSKKKVTQLTVPAIDYPFDGLVRKGKVVKSVELWVKENW